MTRLAAIAMLPACLGLLLATGCKRGPDVFVPLQRTAAEQFQYAVNYRDRNALTLRNDERPEQMNATRDAAIRIFEKVVEYFPEDREVTPLARLELADFTAGLDPSPVEVSDRQVRSAIDEFQNIRSEYPDFEFVQAKSIFDEARCRVRLKDYEKAQELFGEIEARWAQTEDRDIQAVVALSRKFYQRSYVR